MEWLDQNLDAYRIIAEMLSLLRASIKGTLHEMHGDSWPKEGLPQEVFDRLVGTKEKERAIDWYESEYQQLIDYATFEDFLEIIEHNLPAFPHFLTLAPNHALLHARLLELEVMRAKLGRARDISEPELSFLSTFHLRLRDALAKAEIQSPTNEPGSPTDHDGDDAEHDEEIAIDEPPTKGKAVASAAVSPPKAPKPVEAVKPPQSAIEGALENNDSHAILRELYTEITKTADSLWSDAPLTSTTVWDKVAVSEWYQKNISRLGLKPISDFYEVVSDVSRKMQRGLSRVELQDHLKECNFAQILLALRDMFQRNNL